MRVFDTYEDTAMQPSYASMFKKPEYANGWGGFCKADLPSGSEDCQA